MEFWGRPLRSSRSNGPTRRIGPFHAVPLLVAVLLMAVTAAVTVFAADVVGNQESRLLTERANEVNLVLSGAVSTIEANLQSLSEAERIAGPTAFAQAAAAQMDGNSRSTGLALLHQHGDGFVVVAAAGSGLSNEQEFAGSTAAAMRAAQTSGKLVATGVYRSGSTRSVGFALGLRDRSVVFEQILLGPVRPPSQARSRPFSEVNVVLYAASRPDVRDVVVATSGAMPLRGQVRYVPLLAGTTPWLTGVSAKRPLIGSAASAAPWVALTVGLVGSALVFLLLEGMAWRRDEALEAQATEHRFAEALQRKLLPTVPVLAGLDVASSYVPGADNQQVGGDWFDVFELPSGQVAVVIGDVMGHDVEAAAIMAQLRASLRAFASEGGDPAWTVARLAGFMELFAIPALVTVVYGVLDPSGADGGRRFSWCNAGHLPPLVRLPDGRVEELAGGASPLLGAPSTLSRPAGETVLPPGSSVLMYTDGLVEVQGESLGVTVAQLCDVLSRADRPTAEEICASVLDAQLPTQRRDDVAMVIVRVGELAGPVDAGDVGSASAVNCD